MVTGTPVVIGAVILGVAVAVLLMSLGRTPGPRVEAVAGLHGHDGGFARADRAGRRRADAGACARERARSGFTPRIVSLEPEFTLLGGRPHTFAGRPGRGLVLPLAGGGLGPGRGVRGRLEDLGPPDDTRQDGGVTLHIFRKTTQTIACWQEGPLVYAVISTIPSETVIALARRQRRRGPSPD